MPKIAILLLLLRLTKPNRKALQNTFIPTLLLVLTSLLAAHFLPLFLTYQNINQCLTFLIKLKQIKVEKAGVNKLLLIFRVLQSNFW